MPVWTFNSRPSLPPMDINKSSNGFEMVRIYTGGISAQVIDFQTLFNFTNESFIGKAMGKDLLVMLMGCVSKSAIARLFDFPTCPNPAWSKFRSVLWNRPLFINL